MRIGFAGAAVLALMLSWGDAPAQTIPADGLTINDVVTWLQARGYPAQIVNQDGKVHVRSQFGSSVFNIMMFDCKADRCGSLQFYAGFSTHGHFDTSRMNEWNRDERWARGYYDLQNDPWVEMDVDLTPGGTYELLNDELATYKGALTRFMTKYGVQ